MISSQENLPLFSLPNIEDSECVTISADELFNTSWEGILAGFVGETQATVIRTL